MGKGREYAKFKSPIPVIYLLSIAILLAGTIILAQSATTSSEKQSVQHTNVINEIEYIRNNITKVLEELENVNKTLQQKIEILDNDIRSNFINLNQKIDLIKKELSSQLNSNTTSICSYVNSVRNELRSELSIVYILMVLVIVAIVISALNLILFLRVRRGKAGQSDLCL